jgi:hypothetical protein
MRNERRERDLNPRDPEESLALQASAVPLGYLGNTHAIVRF